MLTPDLICEDICYFSEYNLWFLETKIGNYIYIYTSKDDPVLVIKTNLTLNDIKLPNCVHYSRFPTAVKEVIGEKFVVLGEQ